MNSRRMIVPLKRWENGHGTTGHRIAAERGQARDSGALGALASDRADVGTAPVRLPTLIPVKLGD